MKIPFTNIELNFSKPQEALPRRPFVYGGAQQGFDWSGYKISYDSLFTLYRNQSDVYDCIKEWRDNVGLAGYLLKVPGNDEAKVQDSLEKEMKAIFNYSMPWNALKSRVVRDFGVSGNAFLFIVKSLNGQHILGFKPLDPRTMSIVSDEYGEVLCYIQRVGMKSEVFLPEEIIHFKLDNDPNHEVFGFSPMESIVWEIRTDIAAMTSNYFFFENDAKPAVQYVLSENVTKEQRGHLIEQIKQFKGPQNRNKSTVLQGVKEIKTVAFNHHEMEFAEGRRFSTEKICAAYGVPKFILGYTETVNNNNGIELKAKFYESTIRPLEEMFAETMNRFFFQRVEGLKDKVKMEFKPQEFEALKEAKEQRALQELEKGAITLRQYKLKTGQKIMAEDEKQPNFDAYIIHSGGSAVLLEDVGTDVQPNDSLNDQNLQNLLKEFDISKKDI